MVTTGANSLSGNGSGPVGLSRHAVPAEPAFMVVYSESGVGKTTSVTHSFPNAYFIGPPGGITKIAQNVVGIAVQHDQGRISLVEWVVQAIPLIERGQDPLSGQKLQFQPDTVVIDDLSYLSENTLEAAKKMSWPTRSGKPNHFAPYVYTSTQIAALRQACRYSKLNCVITTHEMAAWVDEDTGEFFKGRPKLAGKEAPRSFPPMCDIIVRAEIPRQATPPALGSTTLGAAPPEIPSPAVLAPSSTRGAVDGLELQLNWPGCFRYNPLDPNWITKARMEMPDLIPMNPAELLRHNGYAVKRPGGLEYQEEIVERASEFLLAGEAETRVYREYVYPELRKPLGTLSKRAAAFAMLFARRDILARVALRRDRNKLYAEFGL